MRAKLAVLLVAWCLPAGAFLAAATAPTSGYHAFGFYLLELWVLTLGIVVLLAGANDFWVWYYTRKLARSGAAP